MQEKEQLLAKIFQLQKQIEELKADKSDLEILLDTVTQHSTHLENEIYEKNQIMVRYLQEVEKITGAAAAVEAGTFQIESLDDVAAREDELGQLARVFQNMVKQVKVREEKLKRQLEELKIEIDKNKKDRQVAEIVGTKSFQDLKEKLRRLREQKKSD